MKSVTQNVPSVLSKDVERGRKRLRYVGAVPKPPLLSNRLDSSELVNNSQFTHVVFRMLIDLIQIKIQVHNSFAKIG
jgi:hypothetical protein